MQSRPSLYCCEIAFLALFPTTSYLIVAADLLACRPVSNDIDCADCSFVGRPCAGVASSITFLIPANNNSDILSELLRIAAPLCACT